MSGTPISFLGKSQLDSKNGGPLGNLFRQELRERISWHRSTSRHEWEQGLADAYLRRRDCSPSAADCLDDKLANLHRTEMNPYHHQPTRKRSNPR